MKVRNVMQTNVITVPVGATYEEVARILHTNSITGAPVVDAEGRLVGIVSVKDLFRILFPFYSSYYDNPELYTDFESREHKIDEVKYKHVEGFMAANPVTVDPDCPVMRAGAIMLAKKVHRLPVVHNGRLVGLVTRGTIYRSVLKHHFKL